MCVSVCICGECVGLKESTSEASLGLGAFQSLFPKQDIPGLHLSSAYYVNFIACVILLLLWVSGCSVYVWNNLPHLRTIRSRHCPLAVSCVHHLTRQLASPFVVLIPSLFPRQAVHIWAHDRWTISPCHNDFELKKKKRKKEAFFIWTTVALRTTYQMLRLLRAFIITNKNLWVLSSKGIKGTGFGIIRSWANSPGERTQPIHRRIQLNPAYTSELGAKDVKMNVTHLLRSAVWWHIQTFKQLTIKQKAKRLHIRLCINFVNT